MDSNTTEQQYFGTDLQLTEPHFDEESTVLSARPVVPLDDVKPENRSGRRLAFGLAMIGAILAGALGAGLIYQQRGLNQETAIEETAPSGPRPTIPEGQLLSGVGGIVSDSTASPPPEKIDGFAMEPVQRGDVPENRKQVPSLSSKPARVKAPVRNESIDDLEEWELRRAERIEARRRRREAKREARGDRRRQSSEDLLRIREIFEGSRRP